MLGVAAIGVLIGGNELKTRVGGVTSRIPLISRSLFFLFQSSFSLHTFRSVEKKIHIMSTRPPTSPNADDANKKQKTAQVNSE